VQALHLARNRSAFQRRLIDQPLMECVLADLALESEAATVLALRVAAAFDEAVREPAARPFARIATAIAKYWICKRAPGHVGEALECHGGNGYIEECMMPRLYREAPVNSIWEGSGNVICLDVLRALQREPESADALLAELRQARGAERRYARLIERLERALASREEGEARARRLVEDAALALQASLFLRHGPEALAAAFCAARLGEERGLAYGALPAGSDCRALIERALPVER